ncbi:MAG TPA: hypothetical protein VHR45_22865 [Thermoanaerobaculia bacterium]|nr:hypothetical protein [Thermoanaerobaculia bacterium]
MSLLKSTRSVAVGLVFVGALSVASGAVAAPVVSEERGRGVAAPTENLALEISSADGKWYVQVAATDFSPVRLSLLGDRAAAVLVSTRLEGDKLLVTLASEKGELDSSPIGHYEVRLGEGAPVAVHELESWKTGAWRMKVLPLPEGTMPGCCSCTPMYSLPTLPPISESAAKAPPVQGLPPIVVVPAVQCCPYIGKCMGCGGCGQCCG